MTPSDRIKREIEAFAEEAQSFYCREDEIIQKVTKIVDEAVREAILTTAKVLK